MENIKIKYTSIATPPEGIVASRNYTFGKDENGYFCTTGVQKIRMELDMIKSLFSPVGKTWNDIFTKPKNEKKTGLLK